MAAGTVTADGRARVLADGNEIPLVGLGVWQVPDGRECEDAVGWALEAGYRHVDTAQAYGNEPSVGRALRDSVWGAQRCSCSSPVLVQEAAEQIASVDSGRLIVADDSQSRTGRWGLKR